MCRPRDAALALALVAAVPPALADFDANGVGLGAAEGELQRHFPNAHCQPLQWQSRAADRRCDDSRVQVAGIDGSITFYLKRGLVEAFDLRIDARALERLAKLLTERFAQRPAEKTGERTHTFRWSAKGEQALLSNERGGRRATLLVWRGDFVDEIYKVR